MSNKIFIVAFLRDLEKQVTDGHISYSRMVEILNQKAAEHIQAEKDLADARLVAINELLNTLEVKVKDNEALYAKVTELEAELAQHKTLGKN